MGKNFTAAFAVCLAISSLPLACGDDEPAGGGGGDGKGGKGGSATGGTAGSATGGKGGATGGSATGGASGTAGKGGAGGTGPTGGTSTGGTDGGNGGADGGMGGEAGGGTTMTLCERFCIAGEAGNCTNNEAACITACEYNYSYGGPTCADEMNALYECSVAGTAANWECAGMQPSYGGAECMDEAMAAAAAYCF